MKDTESLDEFEDIESDSSESEGGTIKKTIKFKVNKDFTVEIKG